MAGNASGTAATDLKPLARVGASPPPIGRTFKMLLRRDLECAYPVIEDLPVLLAPEALVKPDVEAVVDLRDPKYAEAYEEREYYDKVADQQLNGIEDAPLWRELSHLRDRRFDPERFPHPRRAWIDAPYEPTAQWRAFRHIGPLTGKTLLQLGGKGVASIKLLFAGLKEAWLLTPMVNEALYARELARRFDVEDRIHCIIGVAEELPFPAASFDVVYSVGCAHHMVTEFAFPEVARVLRSGGKFAAIDPWRAPLHGIGTRLLGKRAPVHCRPFTPDRLAPLAQAFGRWEVTHHGALTRYPLLALGKARLWPGMGASWRITRADDALASLLPSFRRTWGSAVAVLGVKS